MAIDKRTERLALWHFAYPVDLVRTGERLREAENCEEKTKDGYRPDQQSKTLRRVGKNQDGGKVDQQSGYLNENQSSRIRIKRQTADRRKRTGPHLFRMSERKKLKHAQQKHSHQR